MERVIQRLGNVVEESDRELQAVDSTLALDLNFYVSVVRQPEAMQ